MPSIDKVAKQYQSATSVRALARQLDSAKATTLELRKDAKGPRAPMFQVAIGNGAAFAAGKLDRAMPTTLGRPVPPSLIGATLLGLYSWYAKDEKALYASNGIFCGHSYARGKGDSPTTSTTSPDAAPNSDS